MKKLLFFMVVLVALVLLALAFLRGGNTTDTAPLTLTGFWVGEGYTCVDGSPSSQEIFVREEEELVIATKVSGDDCIGKDEVTWQGVRNGDEIAALYHAKPVGGTLSELPIILTLTDGDTLTLESPYVAPHVFVRVIPN